jgi:hypothetical protein
MQSVLGELRNLLCKRNHLISLGMRKLERQLGREVNYTVLIRKEFESRRARKDVFLENVWRNKRLLLIGAREKTKATKGRLGAD